jgi:TP901 family phage tail tape measure protein
MADVQSNIHVNIDTSDALASLKLLQRQISAFHTQMAKSGTAAAAVSANQAQNLMNAINATGQFQASMRTVTTSTESFTNALEKNKLTSREYFRYTGAATKTFGRLFRSEFETLNKVARERVKDIQTQYIKLGRGANGAMQAIAVRPLTLDMKNLGTQTAIAAQRQQLLNQLLKQGSTNLLNFGKNTQWAGRQLMVGFTVPLAMLGTQAAKTFMAMEEQAIRFKRVYGELFTTAEETDAMVKQIQLLAKEYTKYGVAVEETMKMAADAAAMGKMGADLTAQVAQATRLAVLGGVEQAQALETTISVTNAFGVATEDLAKKIDFLNAVENQTVVSIEDLTIAIPKAGPVVQQLGGNVEDLAFFLTAMKEGGINASEGANALKSGLASLINPSEKASKFLAGLGVNIKGIVEGNAGDVKSTVIDFANALDTLDPLNRARAIEQLFGKFQFSRLSTLFQNVTAEGTQAARVLGLTKATTEELAILSERELSKIENTTTYRFKKSIEDLKVTLAPVGEQFLKALTPIVEFAGKILDKFNNLGEGSKKFLTILTVALGAVGPVALMAFGLLANGVANIIKLFATMRSGFQKAGSSTQVLGQQTEYLSQQQLEASAVAASLDQVHQRLKQTFTSEATAVNTLASAYRNAISAQLGFTGPVRGGKPGATQTKAKYSTGTTRVPGTGNQDTVPAVLTPGEAVIPADVAQDPQFKPIINAMVNRRLQGFNNGTAEATQVGMPIKYAGDSNEKLEFAHATEKTIIDIDDVDEEFKNEAQKEKVRGIKKVNAYSGLGFDIPKPLHDQLKINEASLDEYLEEIKKPRAIRTMTENLMRKDSSLTATEAAKVSDKIRREVISSLELLPRDLDKDGNKKPHQIGDNLVASRVGDLKSGIVGGLVEDKKYSEAVKKVFATAGIGPQGTPKGVVYDDKPATPAQLLEAVNKTGQKGIITAVQRLADNYPDAPVLVRRDEKGNIIAYSRPEVGETYRPDENPPYRIKTSRNNGELKDDGKFSSGRANGSSGRVKIAGTASKKIRQAVERALFGLSPAELEGKTVTTYANQIAQGTGFSNLAAKHLSGLHETHDGKKVFVKPMMDLRAALAEQRATQIARDVHGLDAPEQQLRIIQDPVTGKTMYALESAYDAKFNPDNMENKFDKDQYIRQNVAAALRADMDLGRGNLSGNVLADVGPAGVFSRASGERDFPFDFDKDGKKIVNLPSMEEQAIKNLDLNLKTQGRKKFFAEETLDIIKGMTPKEYKQAMIDEIERTLPILKDTVKNFPDLDKDEKRVYKAMIERLEKGLVADWEGVHARAVAPVQDLKNKVAVMPDEAVQENKSKKISYPEMEDLPKNVKSSGGPDDTKMIDKPKNGSKVVKLPNKNKKRKRVGKFTIPGEADAPMATGVVSMPGSAKNLSELTNAYVKGAIANLATAEAAGKKIGAAVVDGAAKEGKKAAPKKRRAATRDQGPAPIGPVAPSGAMVLPLVSRPEQMPTAEPRGKLGKYLADRQQKKADRIAAGKGQGMGMTGGVMAVSGVAMMASMVPGQVGEMATKIMMPLMGISMIMPMLQNKFTALAAGIGLVVAAYAYQRMAFDKAQDAALKLTEAMGSGAEAMKSLSTFAGKVSAGEIMARRRKEAFSPFQIQTGKTTFGQSFVAGEEGKAMIQNVGDTVRSQGKDVAKGQVVNQMATAVASGALNAAQARSIVANLAQEMGDYSFGIEVNGKLNELLGPNGENILKDPVGVRVKLLQDTREKMNLATDGTKKAARFTAKDSAKSVGYTAAGAGGGAVAGAIAGGLLGGITGMLGGPAGAAIGATIGTKVGAVAGAALGATAGNFFGRKDRNKRIGEASGASVAMQKIALQQQQEMMDSVELEYQNKLAVAKAAGDQLEVERLIKQNVIDRNKLLVENGALVADIQKSYKDADPSTQKALMTGADKAVTKQYAGTALEDVVPLAQTQINDSGISKELQYTLKMEMASGQIDPMQMIEIFDTFGNDKGSIEKVVSVVGKFGGAFANQMMGIVGMFKDPKQATDFVARISTKTAPEAQKELELFQRITQLGAAIPDISVALDYYNKNPEAAAALQTTIDKINDKKGKISLEIAATVLGAKEMEILKADQAYFDSLPPEQQKVYMQTLTTMVNMEGNNKEAIQNWLKANPGKTEGDYYRTSAQAVTKVSVDNTAPPKKTGVTGGGSKVDSSPLDEVVKKLRDVRMNQIKVTEGWGASRKALDKLFGGNKTIDAFSGIENDLRAIGGSEDFISLIVGMDPKEYEKKKNSLFEFDNKKNIIGLKRDAKNIQEALNSITMGEFKSSMEADLKAISDQSIAFDKLAKLGVPVADAYELISNKAYASAIANGTNSKTVKTLANDYKVLSAAQKKAASIQNVKTDIAQFRKEREQEERFRKKYSKETVFALKSDQNLRDLETQLSEAQGKLSSAQNSLANKRNIDAPAAVIGQAQGAVNAAQTEVNKILGDFNARLGQLKSTIGFFEDMFNEGFGNVLEEFDIKEQDLQLTFRLSMEDENKAIEDAQNLINDIQYKMDDKEAALREIEKQEEKINEKYDKRIEALDEVEKANAAISAQQRGQLTLAEALTSGDIAAAARAAQEMRAQEAANAVTKQKEALEKSRDYELSRATGFDKADKKLKTRKELEEDIKNMQDEIFKIEEDKLEPNQDAVRLAEIKLNADIKNIKVLEKTRDEWEKIKNEVNLALIKSGSFIDSMKLARDNYGNLVNMYLAEKENQNSDPTPGALLTIDGITGTGVTGTGVTGTGVTGTGVTGTGVTGTGVTGTGVTGTGITGTGVTGTGVTGTGVTGTGVTGTGVTGTLPTGSNRPTDQSSVVQMHYDDLSRIAADAAKNFMLFNQAMNVADVTKNAGNTPGMHLEDLYRQQNAAVVQNAMKMTPGMIAQDKAVADAKARDAALAQRAKDNASADAARAAQARKVAAAAAAAESAKRESLLKKFGGNAAAANAFGNWSMGGLIPKYFAVGGFAKGTDTVPAMLTPGEFIMSKYAVDSYGVDTMRKINNGDSVGGTVYNNTYTLTVNAKTDANPNDIAQAVMSTIKRVDDRRIRGVSLNGR